MDNSKFELNESELDGVVGGTKIAPYDREDGASGIRIHTCIACGGTDTTGTIGEGDGEHFWMKCCSCGASNRVQFKVIGGVLYGRRTGEYRSSTGEKFTVAGDPVL